MPTSVTSRVIENRTIRDEDVSFSAAISGVKVNPDFGNQMVTGDGRGLYNIPSDASRQFLKFRNTENDVGAASHFRMSVFLSKTRQIYVAGHAGGQPFGLGDTVLNAYAGFQPIPCGLTPYQTTMAADEYVEEVYTSAASMYALTNKGNLYAVGYNGYGQLGIGSTQTVGVFYKSNISNVRYFSSNNGATGAEHVFAINTSGEVFAVGYNGYYNLGTGDATSRSDWTKVMNGSLAGKQVQKVYAIGDTANHASSVQCSFAIDSNRDLHVVGSSNNTGMLGLPGQAAAYNWTQVTGAPTGFKVDKIVSSLWYTSNGGTFALDRQLGKLYACGNNGNYQIGDGTNAQRNTFVECTFMSGLSVVDVFLSNYHAANVIALISDGSIRTWGENQFGVTGIGNRIVPYYEDTPLRYGAYNPPVFGPSNKAIKICSAGNHHATTYVLDERGRIWSAGHNPYGQRGLGWPGDYNDTFWNSFQVMIPPYQGCRFVDMVTYGPYGYTYREGNGLVAVDSRGDLYGCGFNGDGSCGVPTVNGNKCPVLTRAHII